jgi:hypothetical protein
VAEMADGMLGKGAGVGSSCRPPQSRNLHNHAARADDRSPIATTKQLPLDDLARAENAGVRPRFRCLQTVETVRLFRGVRGFSGILAPNRIFKRRTGFIFAAGKIAASV